MRLPRRWTTVVAALLAIAAGLYAFDASPVGVYYDDAHYVLLGKALADGQGYRYLNLPGAPEATHYPPAYPLLLAALWRVAPVFPANVVLFKLANVALLGLAALGTLRLARRRLGLAEGASLAVVAASVATVPMLFLSTMLLSEPLFIALLLPVLLWAEEHADAVEREPTGESDGHALRWALALGAAAGALTLVRTHAIALPPAIAIALWHRGRRREALAVIGASLLTMAPWFAWVARHDAAFSGPLRGNYGSYMTWLVDGVREHGWALLAGTARRNVQKILSDSALYLQMGRGSVLHDVAVLALIVGLVAGARALARRAPVTLGFLALYMSLVVIWPFWPMRFVFGVWPLVVIVLAAGIQDAWQTRDTFRLRHLHRLTTLTAGVLLVVGMCWSHARAYPQRWWGSLARANARPLLGELAWVLPHTRPGDIVGTVNQPAVFLYTGRLAVPIVSFTPEEYVAPRETAGSVESMRALMRTYPPNVLIATTPDSWRAAAALAAAPQAELLPIDTLPRIGVAYRHAPAAVARSRAALREAR